MAQEYEPQFHHDDWIDNEDVVQAGGDKGFNQRFHALEEEFIRLKTALDNFVTGTVEINGPPLGSDRPLIINSPGDATISLRDTSNKTRWEIQTTAFVADTFGVLRYVGGDVTTSMTLDKDGQLQVNRAKLSQGLIQTSSLECKENIVFLSTQEAVGALEGLEPVKFNYKADQEREMQLGFIAEDVPDMVATRDKKGIRPTDIVAVLTKVVQEQQKALTELQEKVRAIEGLD